MQSIKKDKLLARYERNDNVGFGDNGDLVRIDEDEYGGAGNRIEDNFICVEA